MVDKRNGTEDQGTVAAAEETTDFSLEDDLGQPETGSDEERRLPPSGGANLFEAHRCRFPSWVSALVGASFILAIVTILAVVLTAKDFRDNSTALDAEAIQAAITEFKSVKGLDEKIDDLANGLGEDIPTLQTGLDNLTAEVVRQATQIAELQNSVNKGNETLGKIASQLLVDGNSLCWSSPQFGWNETELSAGAKIVFVTETIPKIKQAATENTGLVIRVVGRVDRSSKEKEVGVAHKKAAECGIARAATIAKLLRENGVDVAVETWAYSYTPNRRQSDIYLEPKTK